MTFGQTAENNQRPTDWPSLLPPQIIHGRTLYGELTFDEGVDKIQGVVKIRIGVDKYGDVATMRVLSGDKALVKDAKSFLVKSKFPKDPDQNRDPMSDWTNRDNPDYSQPVYGDVRRFRVYQVIFSAPKTKTKP